MFSKLDVKGLEWSDLDGLKCTLRHIVDAENGELLVAITDNKEMYVLDNKVKYEEERYCI